MEATRPAALSPTSSAEPDNGPAIAGLIERIVRGIERGSRGWTMARKKDSLQRVLTGSRSDAKRLQQRLTQLVASWDSDAGEAEVALLLVDQRDRPLLLLASTRLSGKGGALPFSLRFAPNQLAPGMRAELRARVSQGGVLTLHLPPRQIDPSVSVALGELRLVPAP